MAKNFVRFLGVLFLALPMAASPARAQETMTTSLLTRACLSYVAATDAGGRLGNGAVICVSYLRGFADGYHGAAGIAAQGGVKPCLFDTDLEHLVRGFVADVTERPDLLNQPPADVVLRTLQTRFKCR